MCMTFSNIVCFVLDIYYTHFVYDGVLKINSEDVNFIKGTKAFSREAAYAPYMPLRG